MSRVLFFSVESRQKHKRNSLQAVSPLSNVFSRCSIYKIHPVDFENDSFGLSAELTTQGYHRILFFLRGNDDDVGKAKFLEQRLML